MSIDQGSGAADKLQHEGARVAKAAANGDRKGNSSRSSPLAQEAGSWRSQGERSMHLPLLNQLATLISAAAALIAALTQLIVILCRLQAISRSQRDGRR